MCVQSTVWRTAREAQGNTTTSISLGGECRVYIRDTSGTAPEKLPGRLWPVLINGNPRLRICLIPPHSLPHHPEHHRISVCSALVAMFLFLVFPSFTRFPWCPLHICIAVDGSLSTQEEQSETADKTKVMQFQLLVCALVTTGEVPASMASLPDLD
jgi:hypothetical protein